jgi:hypothetical protein
VATLLEGGERAAALAVDDNERLFRSVAAADAASEAMTPGGEPARRPAPDK